MAPMKNVQNTEGDPLGNSTDESNNSPSRFFLKNGFEEDENK